MKLIHLSDLHLGKRVNAFSMLEDQQYILEQILHILDTEQPDAVLIAGDVYDKTVPSAEAVKGGSVDISITEEANHVCLCVADTGIGIPPEHHSKIFERFYRVDKSHSRQSGGTGLGLSIVKHAVKQHHGTITVDSQVGQGTRITVTLKK